MTKLSLATIFGPSQHSMRYSQVIVTSCYVFIGPPLHYAGTTDQVNHGFYGCTSYETSDRSTVITIAVINIKNNRPLIILLYFIQSLQYSWILPEALVPIFLFGSGSLIHDLLYVAVPFPNFACTLPSGRAP